MYCVKIYNFLMFICIDNEMKIKYVYVILYIDEKLKNLVV